MIEHKSISISDQVFENLERDILSGKYERGEILTEMKLSEALGVSRTPIREALRRLAQEHIIEIGTKGAVVIGISEEDIAIIYEIRRRIEGIASAMAATRASDEDIEALRSIVELQEFYTEKGKADSIKEEDSEFHRKLYEMSGSTPLSDTLESLHKKVVKYRKASVSNTGRATNSLKEHRAIFEAVAAHDAALAEKLTVTHVENAAASITKMEK